MLKNKISSALIVVLFCTATCFADPQQKIRYQGEHVTDFNTQQMIKKEITTWKEAPLIERILLVTKSVTPNVTVYEMKYKAKNGDICDAEWVQAKLPSKMMQSSHEYECHKEAMKRRRMHRVLNKDKPMFAPNENVDQNQQKMKHHKKHHHKKGQPSEGEPDYDDGGSEDYSDSGSSASDDDSGDDDA
ncbi:hypothetical protein GE061_010134 [Apolygus lucorum]|uniref:Cystatin domain-containing protein n=1 Tax=Apolygus lucorum TaxID=248454 RepID=A0A8S9Y270_APOLU|nr:hypothetical protein GE061_010134 [Apolygus lucorum]